MGALGSTSAVTLGRAKISSQIYIVYQPEISQMYINQKYQPYINQPKISTNIYQPEIKTNIYQPEI